MKFRDIIDEHIVDSLEEGGLPDTDVLLEIEIAGQQSGPRSRASVGPKGSSKIATYTDHVAPPRFGGAGQRQIPPSRFASASQRQIPPARFSGAARMTAEAIEAVFADLAYIADED